MLANATSAAAASVSTQTSDGLLQKLLDALIKNTSDLTRILEASMTTIRQAKVSAADEAFGFVVEGQIHSGGYARSAADLRVRWKLQFWGIDMAIRDSALKTYAV